MANQHVRPVWSLRFQTGLLKLRHEHFPTGPQPIAHYKGEYYYLFGPVYWVDDKSFLVWYDPKYRNEGLLPAVRPLIGEGGFLESVARFAEVPQ